MILVALLIGFGIGLGVGLFADWIFWFFFDEERER